MILEEFIERLAEISGDRREEFLVCSRGRFSKAQLAEPAGRKSVAVVSHEFLVRVAELKDEDWGEFEKLSDIYDCKVCANAIAQVCVRGVMKPLRPGEFGGEPVADDEELRKIIDRLRILSH